MKKLLYQFKNWLFETSFNGALHIVILLFMLLLVFLIISTG
jgi:hypothetical protein